MIFHILQFDLQKYYAETPEDGTYIIKLTPSIQINIVTNISLIQ